MDTIVFFINIIFIIVISYFWITSYLDNKTLEKGINKFIKDEHDLNNQITSLTEKNIKLNTEMDEVVNEHNKIVDNYNSLQRDFDIEKQNNASVVALRNFYNQMFKDVIEQDPQCIDKFFSIVTKKDYTELQHPEISNNAFNPYEVLKECLNTQINK